MKTIRFILCAAVAVLLLTTTGWSSSTSTRILISCHVDKFAEWADESPVIIETDWSAPINKVNQSRTVSKAITLYTNTDAIISAKPGLNGGVLTSGSSTLQTAYKITGAVALPDSSFKDAALFLNPANSYTVIHQADTGVYHLNLEVQATSPSDHAAEEGTYACGVILTATW